MGTMGHPAPRPARPSNAPWAFAAAAVLIVAIVSGVLLYVFRSARRLPADMMEGSRQAARELRDVAAAFRTGTVTTTFRDEAARIQGSARLQVAELRQIEIFERRDEAAILWGALRLPDVVVDARTPVEYVYFVDLEKEWRFRLEDRDVYAISPPVEWNRPAVDVSALRYEVRAGSVFRDEALVQDRLRDELTALAAMRARQHIAVVRETARRKIEAFVETWLVRGFSDGSGYRAHARFRDETAPEVPSPPALPSPAG